MTPNPQHQTTPAPFGSGYRESRIATQDGYLWPVERRLMVSPGAIRERMAEDIHRAIVACPADECVCTDDLVRLGWGAVQVAAYADAAFSAVKAERRAAGRALGRAA